MERFNGYIPFLYLQLKDAFEGGEPTKGRLGAPIGIGLMEEIRLESVPRAMIKPSADLAAKRIVLDEGFLSYLWCATCFLIGIMDIYHEKAMKNPDVNVVRLSDSPIFPLLESTLTWGCSLKDEYSAWPDNIPNPSQNTELADATNKLWFLVLRYLMYHELGHLVMHSTSIDLVRASNRPFFKPSPDERRRLKAMENQADDFALDLLLSSSATEHDRYLRYLGAVVAYLASFFLLIDGDTRGDLHPDIDARLSRLLRKVTGLGEMRSTLLTHITNIGLQVFMTIVGVTYVRDGESVVYNDFGDLHHELFDILSRLKEKYHHYMPFKSTMPD